MTTPMPTRNHWSCRVVRMMSSHSGRRLLGLVGVVVVAVLACGSCCGGVVACWAVVGLASSSLPCWSPDMVMMMPPLPLLWRVFARRQRQEPRRPLFTAR